MSDLPEHVRRNRLQWDRWAADYVEPGRRNWNDDEPSWGIWSVPESQLGVLPDTVEGLDTIELGCGTGYVSAWLARRGARPVGIDNSEAQLSTARTLQREHGLEFPLLHGNAEAVPLPDAGFDLAISEYGASIWCDPYLWIPEAARLLRPGGRLIFLVNGVLAMLTIPDEENAAAGDRLLRPYFGMRRFELVRRRLGGLPPPARRDAGAVAPLWLRSRGAARDPAPGGLHHPLPVHHPRLGSALALRRGVEGPKNPRTGPRLT